MREKETAKRLGRARFAPEGGGGGARASSFYSNKPPLECISRKTSVCFSPAIFSLPFFYLHRPDRARARAGTPGYPQRLGNCFQRIHVGRLSDPQRVAKGPLSSSRSLGVRKLGGGGWSDLSFSVTLRSPGIEVGECCSACRPLS